MSDTNCIPFEHDGWGSPSAVVVLSAPTWLGLRQAIRGRRWRRDVGVEGCPGRCYATSCKILHVAAADGVPSAVCLVTSHYDV